MSQSLAVAPSPLDGALDNISRLIQDALVSTRRTRFAEIIRYARVASQLIRAVGGGVGDFDIEDMDVIEPAPIMPIGPRRVPAPGGDVGDIFREILGPLVEQNRNTAATNARRAAAADLDELHMLLVKLEPSMPGDPDRLQPEHRRILQERADMLMAKVEKSNAVLRAELLRGHSPDGAGQVDDARPSEQGLANGEGGTRLATGEVVLDPE